MSGIVLSAIAAETALLERVVQVPTGAIGYGTDLSCVEDISVTLDEVDPTSTRAIREALLRRLTTPRGGLQDDPDYGFDVRGLCNRGLTQSQMVDLSTQVRNEVTKDDRVDSATVTVTAPSPRALRIGVVITPVDQTIGIFTLTFAVTDGAVLAEALT